MTPTGQIKITEKGALLIIAEYPFFVGPLHPDDANALPECLPIYLGIDQKYAIPRLIMTDQIRSALQKAYAIGSMVSTPLGESPLAAGRMNEVLDKLTSLFNGAIRGKSFLEIGCGNGELLNQLKLRGAIVTGLEIGPQAAVVENRYGIKVIKEPLTANMQSGPFDCIYSYGCLEHIDDLDGFFAASRHCLKEQGLFFHSVPNAQRAFDSVQLDHLQHEHVNYFTPNNGVSLFTAQGFTNADYSLTKAGNELLLWGYHQASSMPRWPIERIPEETALIRTYAQQLTTKRERTHSVLKELIANGASLGFYAGGYEYGYFLKSNNIRYFDGDRFKHGKRWLKSLPPIESPSALIDAPVDHLIVCKPHYFHDIQQALVRLGVVPNSIVNIDGITANNAMH